MEIALGLGPTPPGPFPPKWGHVTHRPALPDLRDVRQVGRAPEILQIWTLLTTNPPAQLHFRGFAEVARPAGRPAGRVGYFGVHFGTSGWEGRERVETNRKNQVLRIKCFIVENVPTPQESLWELFLTSQPPI